MTNVTRSMHGHGHRMLAVGYPGDLQFPSTCILRKTSVKEKKHEAFIQFKWQDNHNVHHPLNIFNKYQLISI